MANDNTLGAPTEGLGQTVTFTSAGVAVPQARGARRQGLRAGQQGNGTANLTARHGPIQDAREGAAVLDVFRRLGNDILAPRLEQARNDAFLTGMQRAAGGEAIKEIVNEQPWYSQVFGDTPVVEGARAFSSYARVQEEALAIENDMPNLRQRSPSEVQGILAQRLSAIQTGDRGTDSLVMQSMMKELPGIMKRHAKEHLGWQQDNYAKQWHNGVTTASNRFAATMARFNPDPSGKPEALLNGGEVGAVTDAGDVLEAKIAFVQSFVPTAGIPADTYDKLTTNTIGSLLSQGNLHAYYALDDAKLIDNLSPESASKLRLAADRAEGRARAEMPLAFIDELAKIKTLPALFDQDGIDEQLNERVAALNRKYNSITGAREPLLSGNTVAELKNSIMEKQIAADRRIQESYAKVNDRRLDEATKQAEREVAARTTQSLMLEGGYIGDVPADLRREVWRKLYSDPDRTKLMRARALQINQEGGRDTEGMGHIQTQARMSIDSDNPNIWEQLYQTEFKPLLESANGKDSVARVYFGDYAEKMAYYHSIRPANASDSAILAAFVQTQQPRRPDVSTDKKSLDQQVVKALADVADNTYDSGWLTSDGVREADLGALRDRLIPAIKAQGSSGDIKDRVKAALVNAKDKGLEIGGGYYWDAGSGPKLLTALNNYGAGDVRITIGKELNEAVRLGVESVVKATGMIEHKVVYHNQGGTPRLLVMGIDEKSGMTNAYPLTVDSIHAKYIATKKAAEGKLFGTVPLQYGPKKTFVPAEGAKSIYDR